ncbi:MAG: radical SAM protein [Planctomycetes bacterium]|nr:radical SAM protein [Planctomycetota bacterium]
MDEERKLRVSEIFRSIQGESTLAGTPCTFVRLAGCNLNCSYCDTRYAAESEGIAKSGDQICREVLALGTDLICITGGEPLLQKNTLVLVQRFLDEGKWVQVETNGSQNITPLPNDCSCILDVKCPGSGEAGTGYEKNFAMLKPNDEVKFVISDRKDFDWAIDFVIAQGLMEKCPVLFSPVYGILSAQNLAHWILESGYDVRLQLQLHKIIWPGQKKGV